jgi:hypothetical protein
MLQEKFYSAYTNFIKTGLGRFRILQNQLGKNVSSEKSFLHVMMDETGKEIGG